MLELFTANIPVFRRGYRWEKRGGHAPKDGTGHCESNLVLSFADDEPGWPLPERFNEFDIYDPFRDETALFRVFADLQPTEEAIAAFANRYGLLEVPEDYDELSSLLEWQRWISMMRQAVELWDAIRDSNTEVIRQHLVWTRQSQVKWTSPLMQELNISPEDVDDDYTPGDYLQPALELLGIVIGQAGGPAVGLSVTVLAGCKIVLSFQLSELRSALWIQFALAVAEEKEFRRCECCRRPFELAPHLNRKDRRFCSDACRSRSYRHRKARAIQMRAKGRKLRQIAKDLGSDMKTIKSWLGEGS